mgnify:CR=1 FL=1
MYQAVALVNPAIVCLQETKLHDVSLAVVQQCLGNKFGKFFYLPAVGTRGGILLAWDPLVVQLSDPHYTENAVTALFTPVGTSSHLVDFGGVRPYPGCTKDRVHARTD